MANDGQSLTSAAGSSLRGAFRSSTMIVMMTAITPSENASSRALEKEPPELDLGRGLDSLAATALAHWLSLRARRVGLHAGGHRGSDAFLATRRGGHSCACATLRVWSPPNRERRA